MSAQIADGSGSSTGTESNRAKEQNERRKPWFIASIRRFGKSFVYLVFGGPQKSVFTDLYEHLRCEETQKEGCSPMAQSEAYLLEAKLLGNMKRMQLIARIQALRQSLFDMLPKSDYDEMMRQIAGGRRSNEDEEVMLRLEAKALLDRVYRRYLLVPKVEQIRSRISLNMIELVGGISLLLVAYLYFKMSSPSTTYDPLSIACVAALIAGSTGATVSTLIRFQKIDPRRDPLMVWLSLNRDKTLQWLSPFLGALFGFVFFLLMRSELLSGDLFPDFDEKHWENVGVGVHGLICSNNAECSRIYGDVARLVVWCFVAGWAERLVPDVLNRLADHARGQMDFRIESLKKQIDE